MDKLLEEKFPEILIVDDDSSVVIALHKVLQDIGRIRFASTASQALEMINGTRPDLILLDVELPDINGLKLCIMLKQDVETASIPVLFITSKIETGFEEKVFDAGASDFITKPLKPRVVAARVQTHLAYHKALVQLNKLAHTDSLSGLANRLSFDEQLDIEFRRARRQQEPLSIVMIDIDEFKKYNDYFGHVAGDDCIKAIGRGLNKITKRPADFAARFGGEEFSLILPNTDKRGADVLIGSLMSTISDLAIKHAPEAIYPIVTVSVGFSTLEPMQCDFSTIAPLDVVSAADKALYQSKHDGRNRYSYQALEV
ncbi:diguanylate cyclase [Vibrio plantisponsor]|jgi:diguanylate cyclase (GGDEF)-like protein|uniref:diguanylate cyclase n=1 Tax=Vibrio plantisponsor TaxID=664643 RepID=A0ABU4IG24_9VIBR|nr:diguanylate cyclase [Vibrio plantisponsor]MDW6017491.1 diguanylate cyclase [Vibrio plantisponsor]NNM42570.1 diguanylate cyclase [Vibrio plantisponsor]PNH89102.1 diguanylate cyclase response regulator [Vibrio diazotrophicus]